MQPVERRKNADEENRGWKESGDIDTDIVYETLLLGGPQRVLIIRDIKFWLCEKRDSSRISGRRRRKRKEEKEKTRKKKNMK